MLIVGQSRTHFWFLMGMALVLSISGIAVVNRPLAQSYPAGLFIFGIFALVGAHVFSSRLILDGDHLMLRRYGLTWWKTELGDTQFIRHRDDAFQPAWNVVNENRKVGTIQSILFEPRQLAPLLEQLGLSAD